MNSPRYLVFGCDLRLGRGEEIGPRELTKLTRMPSDVNTATCVSIRTGIRSGGDPASKKSSPSSPRTLRVLAAAVLGKVKNNTGQNGLTEGFVVA